MSSIAVSWGLLTPTSGCLCPFYPYSNQQLFLEFFADFSLMSHSATNWCKHPSWVGCDIHPSRWSPWCHQGSITNIQNHQSCLGVLPTLMGFLFILKCNWAQYWKMTAGDTAWWLSLICCAQPWVLFLSWGVQYVLDGHIFLKTQIEKEIYMTTSGRMILNIFTFSFCVLYFLEFFTRRKYKFGGEKRKKKTTYLQKERALMRSKSIRCYLKRYEINTNLSGVL